MRSLSRNTREEEEEESVFVPMTDMTVSFLFILMILLAFFAVQITDNKTVPVKLYDETKQALLRTQVDLDAARHSMLSLTAENIRLAADVAERDATIATQQREIAEKTARIAELEAEVIRLTDLLKQQNPLEAYIKHAAEDRAKLLKTIRSKILMQFPSLKVDVSPEQDALRFQGEGLFASNIRDLVPDKRLIIERIAELMQSAIQCFTLHEGGGAGQACNPNDAIIDAIQIEGHTDGTGSTEQNIDLSTGRANAAFLAMIKHQPGLLDFKNTRKQPVLSVAGYGMMRPIADNKTPEGRSANRRIDLRIIMYTPGSIEEVDAIRSAIAKGLMPNGERP